MSWKTFAVCAALLPVACAPAAIRPAPFRQRPDSVFPGDLGGPFEGRVIDADTGRPVGGALVLGTWTFIDGKGLNAPTTWREKVTTTDANGRYRIPRVSLPSGSSLRLSDFTLLLYKKGFVAYRSDRRFDDFGPRGDFAQLHLEVKLERWHSDVSHVRHLAYAGTGPALAALLAWELPEAAVELAGRTSSPTRAGAVSPTSVPVLAAKKLLTAEDLVGLTGYKGSFDIGELGDQPASASYDNVHFTARNQSGEGYDVALRVWHLDPAEAQQQYGRLGKELPNAREKNEIGDRSMRAVSEARDIFGMAFLDGRHGVVVLLTCGASQCRSPDVVLSLARRVKERIDESLGGTP